MTRMPGEPLGNGLQSITTEECSLLASDLKLCFDQLHSIPAPSVGPHISGIGGGLFRCYRILSEHIGPFATEPDFYCYLYDKSPRGDYLEQFGREVHTTPHKICLSRNDLILDNILVDSNRRLSAIIDWECAAWLPEYWDYTRSYLLRDSYHQWKCFMDEVFGLRPEDLRVEMEMWKYNNSI